jgi:hypothetical protein
MQVISNENRVEETRYRLSSDIVNVVQAIHFTMSLTCQEYTKTAQCRRKRTPLKKMVLISVSDEIACLLLKDLILYFLHKHEEWHERSGSMTATAT